MPAVPAPLRTYKFETLNPVTPQVRYGKVTAAYFVADGEFTLFKDEGHAVVLAVRNDFLVMVERTNDDG